MGLLPVPGGRGILPIILRENNGVSFRREIPPTDAAVVHLEPGQGPDRSSAKQLARFLLSASLHYDQFFERLRAFGGLVRGRLTPRIREIAEFGSTHIPKINMSFSGSPKK